MMACHSEAMKSLIATSTVTAWSATSVGSMPCGRLAVMSAISALMLRAERQDVAGVAHRDGQADRRLAVDAEHRLRRIDEAAPHGRDIAQPDDAAAKDEVDVLDVAAPNRRSR